MENSKRKVGKGLKALFVITALVGLIYIGAFVAYALLDEKGISDVLNRHLDGIINLFKFSYGTAGSVIYFAISAFLYALIVCWLIFLVGGIVVNHKRGRKLMAWAVIFTFVDLIVYISFASGSKDFADILEAKQLNLTFALVLGLLISGLLYAILTVIAYFASIVNCYVNAKNRFVEEPAEEIDEDPELATLRRIVREELAACQPFRVVIVGGEVPTNEEPKEEPAEEVKEEAPVEELQPSVDFWEVAREVWPQLDHPNPLPKEQPKPEPVVEEPVEEEEEELPEFEEEPEEIYDENGNPLDNLNRKARLPFIARILKAEAETKVNYNEIKNEVLSYGVKSRLSRSGDVFRLHNKKYVKIFLVGKTLKVYLALDPEDYKDSTIPVEDVGHRPAYAEIPLLLKVRSGLSVRRCKELIKAAMEKDGLTQKDVKDINWVSELRKQNAEKAKNKKASK